MLYFRLLMRHRAALNPTDLERLLAAKSGLTNPVPSTSLSVDAHKAARAEVKRRILAIRNKDRSISRLKFLWRDYKPSFFWFETFELIRKLLQASVVSLLFRGTSVQMLLQMILSLVCALILHTQRPYIDLENTTLAIACQWLLFVVSFVAMLIKLTQTSGLHEWVSGAFILSSFVL